MNVTERNVPRAGKMRGGLRRKIVSSMFLAGSVVMVVGLSLAVMKGRTELRHAIGANFEGLAKETADKVDLAVLQEFLFLDLVVNQAAVRETLEQANARYEGRSEAEIKQLLAEGDRRWREEEGKRDLLAGGVSQHLQRTLEARQRLLTYKSLFLTDLRGGLVAGINPYPSFSHAGEQAWQKIYSEGDGKRVIGDVYRDEDAEGTFVFSLGLPVMDREGTRMIGIVKGVIDLEALFRPLIHPIRFGADCEGASDSGPFGEACTGHAMLVDSEGTVLICPILPTGGHVTDLPLLTAVTGLRPGWAEVKNDGHGGRNSIVGFAPVEKASLLTTGGGGKRWHSFIRQDPRELYLPVRSFAAAVTLSGLILTGLLAAVGLVISKRLVKPLKTLQAGAKQIGEGNLRYRLDLATGDEVEALADTFNEMAARLDVSNEELERKVAERTGMLAKKTKDVEDLFEDTVRALSAAIDAKSPWTAGHSTRVTAYAEAIGREMGLSPPALRTLRLSGLLHDIGKIGTYESILNKPGSLTEEEMEVIKRHPVKGAEILSPISQMQEVIPVILHHHENFDGNGYPAGLKGEAIPLAARILSVADIVDAMGADRPYRDGKPIEVIIAELKRCAGTQFDPKVVEAFLAMITERSVSSLVSFH